MVCTSGPPCSPGNVSLSSSFWNTALHSTSPPRGPRNVLCVVVLKKSDGGPGQGSPPPATSPAMCAMSTKNSAPTDLAAAAMRGPRGGLVLCKAVFQKELDKLT